MRANADELGRRVLNVQHALHRAAMPINSKRTGYGAKLEMIAGDIRRREPLPADFGPHHRMRKSNEARRLKSEPGMTMSENRETMARSRGRMRHGP